MCDLELIYSTPPQIFISFFFKQRKQKKVVKVKGAGRNVRFCRPTESDNSDMEDEQLIVLDAGDSSDDVADEIAVNEEADATMEGLEDDEGQGAHNEIVVKTIRGRAIQYMEKKGIVMDSKEVKEALQIFPKVSPQYILDTKLIYLYRSLAWHAVFMIAPHSKKSLKNSLRLTRNLQGRGDHLLTVSPLDGMLILHVWMLTFIFGKLLSN